MWLTLLIVVVTYVGASVKTEVPFSDIRTIVIIFILTLLPFTFTSNKLLTKINAKKTFLILVLALMILSSLRTIYEAYPKSIYDPINVVEDDRVDLRSKYYVGDFLNSFCAKGFVALDYKTYLATYTYQLAGNYKAELLSESSLSLNNIVVFDINGLRYGSIYISSEVYAEAYDLILTQNLIYNSGNITIVHRK